MQDPGINRSSNLGFTNNLDGKTDEHAHRKQEIQGSSPGLGKNFSCKTLKVGYNHINL